MKHITIAFVVLVGIGLMLGFVNADQDSGAKCTTTLVGYGSTISEDYTKETWSLQGGQGQIYLKKVTRWGEDTSNQSVDFTLITDNPYMSNRYVGAVQTSWGDVHRVKANSLGSAMIKADLNVTADEVRSSQDIVAERAWVLNEVMYGDPAKPNRVKDATYTVFEGANLSAQFGYQNLKPVIEIPDWLPCIPPLPGTPTTCGCKGGA